MLWPSPYSGYNAFSQDPFTHISHDVHYTPNFSSNSNLQFVEE